MMHCKRDQWNPVNVGMLRWQAGHQPSRAGPFKRLFAMAGGIGRDSAVRPGQSGFDGDFKLRKKQEA
jgi:hypothetical protein